MQGSEVKPQPASEFPVERSPTLVRSVTVDVEVVPNHVNSASAVLSGDRPYEVDEGWTVTMVHDASENFAALGLESCNQAACTMTPVLELTTNLPVANVGGVATLKHLQGFFINAHDDLTLRRFPVELADVGYLLTEVGIGAVQPSPDTMRAKPFGVEDSLHSAAADRGARVSTHRFRKRGLRPHVSVDTGVARSCAGQRNHFQPNF